MAGLFNIAQAQEKGFALGIVKPENYYATMKKLVNAVGFKDVEEFFTHPQVDPKTGQSAPPPPPPPPPPAL